MCNAKPGERCASDTCDQALAATTAYEQSFPEGPEVTPLDAASSTARPKAKASAMPFLESNPETQRKRRGHNFYHGELDFTLRYPAGWGVLNQPAALVAYTPDKQAYIGMKLVQRDSRLSPMEYLRKGAGGRLVEEESLQQSGLEVGRRAFH